MKRASAVRLWLRPELIALHVLALVAVVGCLAGGIWQYGAYDRQHQAKPVASAEPSAESLAEVWTPGEGFDSGLDRRSVAVRGEFGPTTEQVWVAGKSQQGIDGYWLLAPLVLADPALDNEALLVVRGFASEPATPPTPPVGIVDLEVTLRPGEAAAEPLDRRRVIGSVRIPTLVNELPYRLFPGYGISTSTVAAGGLDLARIPAKQVAWTVGLRNLAYALQWWVFGLFAAYMWWRMCSENVADTRARVSVEPQAKESA